jgi:uncharacterized protein
MTAIPPFSLLVKPAGADCNLNCGYCFYLKKAGLYPNDSPPRMTIETARSMIEAYFAIPQPAYAFAWQGGEPTLMGAEFFREVFEIQRTLAPSGARVTNALQTNGTLVNDDWTRLFRDNNVLVGLSIDGPADIHNAYRRWADGEGRAIPGRSGDTHGKVAAAAQRLREGKVAFNALTVVGKHNQDRAVEVYDYLRSLRIRHMQFIPLVEWGETVPGAGGNGRALGDGGTSRDGGTPGDGRASRDGGVPVGSGATAGDRSRSPQDFSVSAEGWGRFLIDVFDRWFPKDVRRVSIRHHDSIMELLIKGTPNVCTISESCGGHLVVEHTGDIYPCDFYVEPALRLVTIDGSDRTLRDAGESNPLLRVLSDDRYRQFQRRKRVWDPRCESCRYRVLCGGDCPKFRPPGGGPSALCTGWKALYDHAIEDFERLARSVSPEITGQPPAVSGVGRWRG